MSYKYIIMNDRNKIGIIYKEGYSARKIAEFLGYYNSSISRELKRSITHYNALKAHLSYINNSENKGRKIKLIPEIKEFIERNLMSSWSPEQIIGRMFQNTLFLKDELQIILRYLE